MWPTNLAVNLRGISWPLRLDAKLPVGQDSLLNIYTWLGTWQNLKKDKLMGHFAPLLEKASFLPDSSMPDPANPQSFCDKGGENRPAPKTSSMDSTSPNRETAQPQTLAR